MVELDFYISNKINGLWCVKSNLSNFMELYVTEKPRLHKLDKPYRVI